MKIYTNYLLRDLLATFFIVVVSLELIIGGNVFARWLQRIAEGDYPIGIILPFLMHSSTQLLLTMLPFTALLACLLVLGRHQQSGELHAAFFLRFSHAQMVSMLLFRFALPLAIFLGLMSMFIMPHIERHHDYDKLAAKQRLDVSLVTAGTFISPRENLVVFAQEKKNDKLKNLFIAQHKESDILVELAQSGEQKIKDGRRQLHFYQGRRYEGTPGQTEFEVSRYEEHIFLLPYFLPKLAKSDLDHKTLFDLWRSSQQEARVEMHWRASLSFSILVLVLLAYVLVLRCRANTYQAILPAVLVYLVYTYILLGLSSGASHGYWSAYVVWLGHLPFLSVPAWYLFLRAWPWVSAKASA